MEKTKREKAGLTILLVQSFVACTADCVIIRFSQTVLPLAPSIPNITSHYLSRSPQSILHLREDTLSQLLVMANIRPGGRYLVVDDTGGLITAAILDRMGCQGRILTFVDADSPPAWGVLGVTNLSDRELECVKWLNWMEAEEGYERRELEYLARLRLEFETDFGHSRTTTGRRHAWYCGTKDIGENEET